MSRISSLSQPNNPTGTADLVTSDEEVVLGVDTHRDLHVAAVLTTLGVLVATQEFSATRAGYEQLLGWARSFGELRRAGVECTGSYGAALARHLLAEGVAVIEVNQPDKANRRRRGKTDAVDAEAAARAVLSGRATAIAKTGDGAVEALRVLKLARDSAVKTRTKAINQLKAILVNAQPMLRESLAGLGNTTLINRCAGLTDDPQASLAEQAVTCTLRLLAMRIKALKVEARQLKKRLQSLVTAHTPKLLERQGIGPDSAAALLVAAGDNPQRLRHETSYAALCGVNPVEASSGRTHRMRLNRGGDRQANAALYRIAMSRLRWDPRTRLYVERRIREGKTKREAIRCLKHYIAREVFTLLRPPATPKDANPTSLAA